MMGVNLRLTKSTEQVGIWLVKPACEPVFDTEGMRKPTRILA